MYTSFSGPIRVPYDKYRCCALQNPRRGCQSVRCKLGFGQTYGLAGCCRPRRLTTSKWKDLMTVGRSKLGVKIGYYGICPSNSHVCSGPNGVKPIAVKTKWPHNPKSVTASLTSANVTFDLQRDYQYVLRTIRSKIDALIQTFRWVVPHQSCNRYLYFSFSKPRFPSAHPTLCSRYSSG